MFLVVIESQIKNGSGPQLPAEKKAVVNFFVVIVVVGDEAEGEGSGYLETDALGNDIDAVNPFPIPFVEEFVVGVVIKEAEVGQRF